MKPFVEGLGFASMAFAEGRSSRYWYCLAVASRWATRMVSLQQVRAGIVMHVRVDMPGQPLEFFVVDGHSDPLRDRRRMPADLRALLDAADPPIDVVVGDFNAPSRSVGLDEMRGDYWLAAETSGQYAMTWPHPLPLFDLDQIWVTLQRGGRDAKLYTLPQGDHRGQTVRISASPRSEH
ncbi:MAG: endonuclease/exonuclease/phosphatase family protein [Nannocystales bacterium]